MRVDRFPREIRENFMNKGLRDAVNFYIFIMNWLEETKHLILLEDLLVIEAVSYDSKNIAIMIDFIKGIPNPLLVKGSSANAVSPFHNLLSLS